MPFAYPLHGFWRVTPAATLGLFASYGALDIGDTRFAGVEYDHRFDRIRIEIHAGRGEDDDVDVTLYGLAGDIDVTPRFALGVDLDHLGEPGIDLTRFGVTGRFAVTDAARVFGEVGRFEVGDGSGFGETCPGLGVSVAFGTGNEPTFGRRGFLDLLA